MTEETVLLEITGAIATLTFNRPDRRNGMTREMLAEINHALEDLGTRDDVRVLVLRGAGKDFSVGADIGHYGEDPDARFGRQRDWREFRTPVLLREMAPVTVAAIRGGCAGAAFGLACACDFRIVSATARFNTAFLDVGLAGDMGGPWLLPRLVGEAKAKELYLLPSRFGADEAARLGLATQVVDDEGFDDAVEAMAKRLEASAPLALRGMKENFAAAEKLGLAQYLALEAERHNRLLKTADAREAFMAFLEKRPATFEGR